MFHVFFYKHIWKKEKKPTSDKHVLNEKHLKMVGPVLYPYRCLLFFFLVSFLINLEFLKSFLVINYN